MKLSEKAIVAKRKNKKIYSAEDTIVKSFSKDHLKSDIFNEALNQARAEETGLKVPHILEVVSIDGEWSLVMDKINGETLASLIKKNPEKLEEYMDKFVDLQCEMHEKKSPLMNKLKDKLNRQIDSLTEVDATTRYELKTRLDTMPKHNKVCHGDFNPTNIIVGEDDSFTIVDWAHVTQGNASADAAMTYLEFALDDEKTADMYLDKFCQKSDTAKQYVQKWLPIVAAAQLTKGNEKEKEFLMRWMDILDFQ